MLRVGLTGGIATGKTTVGRMFVQLGCHLIDSDAITHDLYQPGQAVYAAVIRAFGSDIRSADGTIDRTILGEIVFNDSDARLKLNSIVHPAVIRRHGEWFRETQASDPEGIAIVDATLMLESGSYRSYDAIVVVSCSVEEQKRRLHERSNLTEEQIDSRIASQMPTEEKIKHSDYVIDNSGDLEATRQQVAAINSKLRAQAANTSGRRHR